MYERENKHNNGNTETWKEGQREMRRGREGGRKERRTDGSKGRKKKT